MNLHNMSKAMIIRPHNIAIQDFEIFVREQN